MIGARLTMRALLERKPVGTNDSWGQPAPADAVSTGAPLPCFVYSSATQQIEDGQKIAPIEDLRIMFALDADVRDDDEIASVTDRSGVTIISGRLKVIGPVQFKHTHREAALRRIG
jgi:hypothetical protein